MTRARNFLRESDEEPEVGRLELADTSLATARAFAEQLFIKYGHDLDDELPNFDENYTLAQQLSRGGWANRRNMPVIRRAQVWGFQERLTKGYIDINQPWAPGTDPSNPFPEGLSGELAQDWLENGLRDNVIPDDQIQVFGLSESARDLHPIQRQIYFDISIDRTAKAGAEATKDFIASKMAIASSDDYIIDGHHRWLSAILIDPDMSINGVRIDLPIETLLPMALSFSDVMGNIRNEMRRRKYIIKILLLEGGESPGTMELVNTDLDRARAFAEKVFEQNGSTLDAEIPDFDKNYLQAQRVAGGGWTSRRDMPVIETDQVRGLQQRLSEGYIDIYPPVSPTTSSNPFPEGLSGEQAQNWLEAGLKDGSKEDDITQVSRLDATAGDLKPIQRQIYFDKSITATAESGVDRTQDSIQNKSLLVVSSDNRIIDGHHRWLSAFLIDPDMELSGVQIDLPIDKLLPLSKSYGDAMGNIRNEGAVMTKAGKFLQAVREDLTSDPMTVRHIRTDDWGRRIHKDTRTNQVYVEVEGVLHTMTDQGEPNIPLTGKKWRVQEGRWMPYSQSATDVIGWAYDADLHCNRCARERFGDRLDDDQNPPEDSEGNPIHPVFASEEFEGTPHCGDCGEELE